MKIEKFYFSINTLYQTKLYIWKRNSLDCENTIKITVRLNKCPSWSSSFWNRNTLILTKICLMLITIVSRIEVGPSPPRSLWWNAICRHMRYIRYCKPSWKIHPMKSMNQTKASTKEKDRMYTTNGGTTFYTYYWVCMSVIKILASSTIYILCLILM